MQRILSGLGIVGSSSTSASAKSGLLVLATVASDGSALAAIASRRLGQRALKSTTPPSTTAPNFDASAWRKLTSRMGWDHAERGRGCHAKRHAANSSTHIPPRRRGVGTVGEGGRVEFVE